MRTMEKAIEGFYEVKFKYRSQKVQNAVQRQVRLFGRFTYIMALTGNRVPIPYRADLITDLEITKEYFNPK